MAPYGVSRKKGVSTAFRVQKSFGNITRVARCRIGPHHQEYISTLVGNLLGDGWGEKRGGGSRFALHMSANNMEHIQSLHQLFSRGGYCSEKKLRVSPEIGRGGKIYYSVRMRTYSFSSLNWLQEAFYPAGGVKRIPPIIHQLLDARALAIWMMGHGGVSGSGCRISTDNFPPGDVELLQVALGERWGCHCTIQRQKDNWLLYFPRAVCPRLSSIIKPLMVDSMHYKLNGY